MYVIVQHELIDPPAAFARGERLKRERGSPGGASALQFFPSEDGTIVTCLWEARSVDDVQSFVDAVLGETSVNSCYAVDADARVRRARPSAILAAAGRGRRRSPRPIAAGSRRCPAASGTRPPQESQP